MKYFLELLQVALGTRPTLTGIPSEQEWNKMMEEGQKQTLLCFLFWGIEKLPEAQRPPRVLLLKWFVTTERIAQRNQQLDKHATRLTDFFRKEGFDCCILKGQGNNLLYPQTSLREPGDVDVYVRPKGYVKKKGEPHPYKKVLKFLREKIGKGPFCYHHADFPSYKGIAAEVHYRPSFDYNLWYNRRLQQWFDGQTMQDMSQEVTLPEQTKTVNVPTTSFNLIFQMSHMKDHFFHEGLGLRQVVDYFYVLKRWQQEDNKIDIESLMKRLGLRKFARAVMYVMHETMGMDERWMVVAMDKKRGQLLLSEIMEGGNFGKYDRRVDSRARTQFAYRHLEWLKRDLRLAWLFPADCLMEPIFRIWHLLWRLANR